MIFLMDEGGYFLEFLGSNSGELLFSPSQLLRKQVSGFLPVPQAAAWGEAIRKALRTQETQVIQVEGFPYVESGRVMDARVTACGVDRVLASLLLVSASTPMSSKESEAERDVLAPPSDSSSGLSSGISSARPSSRG